MSKYLLVQVIITSYAFDFDYLEMETIRALAVFCMLFMYLDVFYWFKIIEKYAMVVRVLQNTIKSVLAKTPKKTDFGSKFIQKVAPLDIVVNVNPAVNSPHGWYYSSCDES